MLSIGALVLGLSLVVQAIFVGNETKRPEPSKHEIDARWDNVA